MLAIQIRQVAAFKLTYQLSLMSTIALRQGHQQPPPPGGTLTGINTETQSSEKNTEITFQQEQPNLGFQVLLRVFNTEL